MKLSKKGALWASILPAMALTACSKQVEAVYSTPPLNAQDRTHLSCADYPDTDAVVRSLPPHVFLSGLNGEPVITDGGHRWVRFDIVNAREGITLKLGTVDGKRAHGECHADLTWLADVWLDLQRTEE